MAEPADVTGYTVKDRRWWTREEEEAQAATESKPTLVASLEAQIAERDRKLAETLAVHRQAVQEHEQARQRIEREARREIERDRKNVLGALIPVLDDLDRAIAAATSGRDDVRAVVRGIELVRTGFLDRLRSLGVEREDPTGHSFDPARHEAIAIVQARSEEEDGRVTNAVVPGYALAGEVLRPARVVVSRRA